MCITEFATSSPAVAGASQFVTIRSLRGSGRSRSRRSSRGGGCRRSSRRRRHFRCRHRRSLLCRSGSLNAAHDALRVHRRSETSQSKRVKKEDRTENGGGLDKHIAGFSTKGSFGHSTADDTAQAALFRLLKQDNSRQKQTDHDFNDIQKTDKNRHFVLFLSKISTHYTENRNSLQVSVSGNVSRKCEPYPG